MRKLLKMCLAGAFLALCLAEGAAAEEPFVIAFDTPEHYAESDYSIFNYNIPYSFDSYNSVRYDPEAEALEVYTGYGGANNLKIDRTIPNVSEYKYAKMEYRYMLAQGSSYFITSGIGRGSGYSTNIGTLREDLEIGYYIGEWFSDIADISEVTKKTNMQDSDGFRIYLGNRQGENMMYQVQIRWLALFKTRAEAEAFSGIQYDAALAIAQNGNVIEATLSDTPQTGARVAAALYEDRRLLAVRLSETTFENKTTVGLHAGNFPEGNYQAKAFAWRPDESQTPIAASAEQTVTVRKPVYDDQNRAGNEWTAIPFRSRKLKQMGIAGGEGAQAILHLTSDSTGNILMSFSDAGHNFRSLDGGETWERCARDVNARSLCNGEIDPNNSARVIALTYKGEPKLRLNTAVNYSGAGLYLSEDTGYSYEQALQLTDWEEGWRVAFAWDPSSYDAKLDGSKICYFSTYSNTIPNSVYGQAMQKEISAGLNQGPGIYRSLDGGKTWSIASRTLGGAAIAVCPANGAVFAENDSGLYRSMDHGETWHQIISGKRIGSVTTITTAPNNVYISDDSGVLISTDCGNSFTAVETSTFPPNCTNNLKISPADPDYMMISYNPTWIDEKYIMSVGSYVSHDGGKSWTRTQYNTSRDFFKHQPRWKVTLWHPTDKNKVWTNSDWVEMSTDGGNTFYWSNNGNCGTCINSPFILNVYNPSRYLVPAQDNRGAYTTDGGDTFTSLYYNDSYYSHTYGGYIVDENTFFYCGTKRWENATEVLQVTHDGGKTFTEAGTVTCGPRNNYCFQSQAEPNVFFAGNLRSEDGGYTWEYLPDTLLCAAAYNPFGKEVFAIGKNYASVYVSEDAGRSWEKLFDRPVIYNKPGYSGINLLAYDGLNNILYFAQADTISKYQNGKITRLDNKAYKDQWRTTLAVDPRYPDVLYSAGTPNGADGFTTADFNATILRSTDGGENWQVISSAETGRSIVPNGATVGQYCTWTTFVHPNTGEVYVGMPNYGLYKFPPPYQN